MIDFHLSPVLLDSMHGLIQNDRFQETRAMHWFVDQQHVNGGENCLLVRELETRYTIPFCHIQKNDLVNFAESFEIRLWREVFDVCSNAGDEDLKIISDLVLRMCSKVRFRVAENWLVEEMRFSTCTNPYRCDTSKSAFFQNDNRDQQSYCDLSMENQQSSQTQPASNHTPTLGFRDFWLGLLQPQQQHPLRQVQQAAYSP